MKSDFLGGLIAVVAALASIFGVNLQKYSHDNEELRAIPRPYHKRPVWWVGMVCVVGASLGDFLALAFAAQTLVASLGGGSTILGNCIMSHLWLKQSLYPTDIAGVFLVTIGVVVLADASSEEEGSYKMDEIYKMMEAAPFLVYCFITTCFVMTLYLRVRRSRAPALRVASNAEEEAPETAAANTGEEISTETEVEAQEKEEENEEGHQQSALMSPFPSPIYDDTLTLSPLKVPGEEDDPEVSFTTANESYKTKKFEGTIEKHSLVIDPKLPLYWAAISGTIGAQSVLLAKCVAEMITSTLSGDNQFKYFGTYVLIGGMVATLLTQTHTLNMATMSGDTMSAYPVFQAFWITMSNISGVVFFQQAHNFSKAQWIMFPIAIACVLSGIFLVSKHEKFGNRVKYSVAMPISLSSPRQHDIVAQSFIFSVSTPQKQAGEVEMTERNRVRSPPTLQQV